MIVTGLRVAWAMRGASSCPVCGGRPVLTVDEDTRRVGHPWFRAVCGKSECSFNAGWWPAMRAASLEWNRECITRGA